MGVQRNTLDQPGNVRSLVPAQVRAELQHTVTDHSWRAGLPRANRRRDATLHGSTAQRHRFKDPDLPGRRPLGPQTPELPALVPHRAGLAGQVSADRWFTAVFGDTLELPS